MSAYDGKVPDGVRYQVLDVWVDGLMECDGWDEAAMMGPIQILSLEGNTKVIKRRAVEVLRDERLGDLQEVGGSSQNGEDGEWEGFAD